MAKPKRMRVGSEQKRHWLEAIAGATFTLHAAARVMPEPNLIAAISLIEAAVGNLKAVESKDGQ